MLSANFPSSDLPVLNHEPLWLHLRVLFPREPPLVLLSFPRPLLIPVAINTMRMINHTAITVGRLFVHISTSVCSQGLIYTDE